MNRIIKTEPNMRMMIAERVTFALMAVYFIYMIIATIRMPSLENSAAMTALVFSFVTALFTMLLYSFCFYRIIL